MGDSARRSHQVELFRLGTPILQIIAFSASKMKIACTAILLLISVAQLTFARTTSNGAEVDTRELVESLRDAFIMKEKREMEAKKEEVHEISARGAWADFKASLKKAGQKVKNAFGKKEAARQFEGPTHEELVMYKQEILDWKQMVRDVGLENEPEIKEVWAKMDEIWEALDLDNV